MGSEALRFGKFEARLRQGKMRKILHGQNQNDRRQEESEVYPAGEASRNGAESDRIKSGFSGSFCEQSLQFRRFQTVPSTAVRCAPFCLRSIPCYLAQHASRVDQAGVSRLDHGGQSHPLRQLLIPIVLSCILRPPFRKERERMGHPAIHALPYFAEIGRRFAIIATA